MLYRKRYTRFASQHPHKQYDSLAVVKRLDLGEKSHKWTFRNLDLLAH